MGDQKSKRFSSRWLARWFVILIVARRSQSIAGVGMCLPAGSTDRLAIGSRPRKCRPGVCLRQPPGGRVSFRIGLLCDATVLTKNNANWLPKPAGFAAPRKFTGQATPLPNCKGRPISCLPGGSGSAQWALLRASLRLGFDGPEAISVEGRALNIAFDRKMATEIGGTTGFTADRANLHVRRNPQNGTGLDLALTVDNSLTNRIGRRADHAGDDRRKRHACPIPVGNVERINP